MHKAVGSAGGPIVVCVFPVNARSFSRGVYLHCGAASCCSPTTLTFPNHTIRFQTPVSWKIFTDSSLNWIKKKLPACCSGKAWILVQRVPSLDFAGTMHCIQTCTQPICIQQIRTGLLFWRCMREGGLSHSLRCNGKAIFQIYKGFKGDIIVCLFLFSLVKCARMPVDTGKTPRLGVNSGVVFLLICSTCLQMNLSRYQSSAFNGSWVYPGK